MPALGMMANLKTSVQSMCSRSSDWPGRRCGKHQCSTIRGVRRLRYAVRLAEMPEGKLPSETMGEIWHVALATGSTWSDGEDPDSASGLEDGYLDTALDDSRADGVAGEARGVVDIQLGHEMLPMLVDSFKREA